MTVDELIAALREYDPETKVALAIRGEEAESFTVEPDPADSDWILLEGDD